MTPRPFHIVDTHGESLAKFATLEQAELALAELHELFPESVNDTAIIQPSPPPPERKPA